MIYTAYYYSGSLDKGDLIIRDNRFYPGKYFETFPVWMQYVRKHYPNEHIIIFADAASPIPIEEGIKYLEEPYDFESGVTMKNCNIKVHIQILTEHTNKYFWAMQRNLVRALCHAHKNWHDFFWIDNDAFLNSDVFEAIKTLSKDGVGWDLADVAAPQINHQQFTCDSVCTYISAQRLRQIPNLQEYLENMLNNGPTETRMHSLQEGGLYKTFCYGKTKSISNINISHLSCYENFMKFLIKNPLPTLQYINLRMKLENLDFSRMKNVELKFHDMFYEEV